MVIIDPKSGDANDIYQDLEVELLKKPGKGLGLSVVGRRDGNGVFISDMVGRIRTHVLLSVFFNLFVGHYSLSAFFILYHGAGFYETTVPQYPPSHLQYYMQQCPVSFMSYYKLACFNPNEWHFQGSLQWQRRDSNPRPLEFELPVLTTKPLWVEKPLCLKNTIKTDTTCYLELQ